MNPQYEKELELEIERRLRSLPELTAPATLARRVMEAIEQRRALRWYNLPWQGWPLSLRVASLALLLTMFGGLCFASFQLTRAAGFSAAFQEVANLFSGLNTLWNIIDVLLGAVVLVAKHFGAVFMIAGLIIVGFGYAVAFGLGTACVRLAFARRE